MIMLLLACAPDPEAKEPGDRPPRPDDTGEPSGEDRPLTGIVPIAAGSVELGPGVWTGWTLATPGDVDGDGIADLVVGENVYSGPFSAGTRPLAGATPLWTTDACELLEMSLGTVGDTDGDGAPELLVGCPDYEGVAWLLGDLARGVTGALATFDGSDDLGSAAAGGDLNGDGTADVVLGAAGADRGGSEAGTVAVYPGPVSGRRQLDAGWLVFDGDEHDGVGRSVAVADLDGDGVDDLIAGARGHDAGGADAGAVFAIFGGTRGVYRTTDADRAWLETHADSYAGDTVATVGDVDGDGVRDLLVSAPWWERGDEACLVYLLPGNAPSGSLSDAPTTFVGTHGGEFGSDFAGEGDVDGDGRADVLIGGSTRHGVAFLWYGAVSGVHAAAAADAVFTPERDASEIALAFAGDLDGDARTDLLLTVDMGSDAAARLFLTGDRP